MGKESTCMLYR